MNNLVENFTPSVRISKDWKPFALKLAAALESLKEDQCLILSHKLSHKVVQFAAQGSFGMRIETISNHFLAENEQLNTQQMSDLLDAGWLAPTKSPQMPSDGDQHGSPNYFLDLPAAVNFDAVASLAVKTFTEILRVLHPAYLQYFAFDNVDGKVIALPELGLKVADRTPQGDTRDLLLDAMKKTTGIPSLDFDADNDIGVGFGSAFLYVGLINKGQHIKMFSIILCDVRESHDLYVRLNEMNSKDSLVRFIFRNRTVVCSAEIRANPFIKDHFEEAFWWFSQVADDMGQTLKSDFGGQVAFPEKMQSVVMH